MSGESVFARDCACGALATVVVVTFTDWIYELCPSCALNLCDPIGATT